MRAVLFFDLPVETSSQQREYRKFIKNMKLQGFYMMQKSVYIKMALDMQSLNSAIAKVKKCLPKDGFVFVLKVTENQFTDIDYLLGESISDVVNTFERVVEL